jgi:hypothetical protein
MAKSTLTTVIWFIFIAVSGTAPVISADPISTLDLVAGDVAVCLEVPELDRAWTRLESDGLIKRLRRLPPFQRFLESQGVRHWQAVEEHVTRQTGSSLSSQLRALFAKSLVVAIHVPATGEPRGILLGEARDADAVQSALSTWNRLEPNGEMTVKSYRNQKYYERKRDQNTKDRAFIVSFDRWFAVSDQEELIQEVIDRHTLLKGEVENSRRGQKLPDSLRESSSFQQNRNRLKTDGVAYVHINARAWDRGLEEAGPIAELWKRVTVVSACLRVELGIVCETVLELDPSRMDSNWSKIVSTAGEPSTWMSRIPGDALFAVAGRLELAPVIQFLLRQVASNDLAELEKLKRVSQSLFGGYDVFETVLPALTRDFGGFITVRTAFKQNQFPLDGALGFALSSPGESELLSEIDHGLSSGLQLIALFMSAEGDAAVTIRRTDSQQTQIRALSPSAVLPIAFGRHQRNLVVAGSEDRLRSELASLDQTAENRRLSAHRERFFSGMNQLIWFDVGHTRDVLDQRGSELAVAFARGSIEDETNLKNGFQQIRPLLALVDSVFISGKIESDHIRFVVGGAIDSNRN